MELKTRAKMRCTYVAAAVLVLAAVQICCGQQSGTNGTIRVQFPTANWAETEPPSELRDAFDGTKSPMKLIFHAVSQSSRLRFYVTRFDYPSNYELTIGLAGYLDGVRRRCARQAIGEVAEESINIGDLPVQAFEAKLPGEISLEIRTILCTGRLYSLEIGGPATSRQEAKRCLEGFSLVSETPVPPSVVEGVSRLRAQTGGTGATYEKGRQFGHAIGFVLAGSLVLAILVLAFRRKPDTLSSRSLPATKVVASPPVPSSATPPMSQSKSKPDDRTV